MKNLKQFYWKLTSRLELFTHTVPLPFAIYLGTIASGLNDKNQLIMVFICSSWASLTFVIGSLWRYFRLQYFFKKMERFESSPNSDLEEMLSFKLKLMRYPYEEGIVIVLRWICGATPALFHTAYVIGFENARLGLQILPFIIFMIAPLSFMAYFFITENNLRLLLQRKSLLDLEIPVGRIPRFSYYTRIILTVFSLANLPFTLFSYMLYAVVNGYLTVQNPILHIFILAIMFSLPIAFVTYVLGVSVKNGIDKVSYTLQEVGAGNFSAKLPLDTIDDFSIQAFHLNLVIQKLSSMYSEIKDLNANLEIKVLERTNQVNEMLDQLGKLYLDSENKRKEIEILAESREKLSMVGQMAAGIVHDIKNPMATIKYIAEMLSSGDVTEESRMENLFLIVREMDRLSDLTYEILDFSKGHLNLNLNEVNLKSFISEVQNFLQMDFEHLGVKSILDLEYEGNVLIDKDRMRRVIVNLSKNAIEAIYDNKKEYSLTIRTEKRNNKIILYLIDNGPGLPKSVEERIFQAFVTEGKANGTGLGLFMCKWIVETHNGELTYLTKSGEGTTFIISLPLDGVHEK